MRRVLNYINPLARLGNKKYSVRFPIAVNLTVAILSEMLAYVVLNDPESVGRYIIFVNVGLIIYFAFRDGIRGGFIATFISVLYYIYIIQTRGYTGQRWDLAVETTFILMLLFLALAATIGYLKQRIDRLIEEETAARQLAEEQKARLETILQQLPVGVLIVGSKGKLESNRQMEQILGTAKGFPPKKINYKSRAAYQKNQPMASKDWPIIRALQKGETVTGEEIMYLTADKKNIHLRVNAAPIKSKDKKIVAAVSTIDDITPEKELEIRKDDFVNMASHELKTPITSLKIYIEVLLNLIQKYNDPKATKTLSSIKTQTERLQELVSDLLDVSRIQTGKLHFKKEQFEINALIAETVDVLRGSTTQKLIFKDSKKVTVNADRFRIYQVITNLITNAIKYSPDGKEIIVEVVKKSNQAVVSVKDQGIGVSKSQQKKIFERLYQVTDPAEKTFPGLGMGLYISKEIIKRHKGSIWVEGDKGKGSTFFFALPLKP